MKYHLFHIYERHYELVFELHTQDSSQQANSLVHLPNLHLRLLIAHLCRSTVVQESNGTHSNVVQLHKERGLECINRSRSGYLLSDSFARCFTIILNLMAHQRLTGEPRFYRQSHHSTST